MDVTTCVEQVMKSDDIGEGQQRNGKKKFVFVKHHQLTQIKNSEHHLLQVCIQKYVFQLTLKE